MNAKPASLSTMVPQGLFCPSDAAGRRPVQPGRSPWQVRRTALPARAAGFAGFRPATGALPALAALILAWPALGRPQEPDALATKPPPASATQIAPLPETDEQGEPEERPESEAAVGGLGVVIPIRTDINDVTTESIERRINAAREAGARVIIFDIHTPGGYGGSALDISHLIKNTRDIHTVAWINTQAYSAGALIAVACDEIVMAPASTMGDSQVILSGPDGASAVPEALAPKVNTPILADFRDSANTNGYDPLLCEAFVLPEREVWWVEHLQTGQREFISREEKRERLGGGADGSSFSSALRRLSAGEVEWKLVESYRDVVTNETVKLRQPVVGDYALLQMSAGEAYAFGFNKGVAAGEEDLGARYGLSNLARAELNWSEELTMWLTSAWVRGILLVLMLLAAYVEFHTPGVGLAGLVALICLVIFAGAPYLTGFANFWEVALIVVGFILLALEAFVIPGFGVAGITGIVFVIVGLLATFVPDVPGRTFPLVTPSASGVWEFVRNGLLTITFAALLSIVGMFVMGRYLPEMEALRRAIPLNPTPEEVAPEDGYHGAVRVGDLGRCETPLRPAGKARFGDVLADVVSQADFVESGEAVEVIERHGNVVVVRPARKV